MAQVSGGSLLFRAPQQVERKTVVLILENDVPLRAYSSSEAAERALLGLVNSSLDRLIARMAEDELCDISEEAVVWLSNYLGKSKYRPTLSDFIQKHMRLFVPQQLQRMANIMAPRKEDRFRILGYRLATLTLDE